MPASDHDSLKRQILGAVRIQTVESRRPKPREQKQNYGKIHVKTVITMFYGSDTMP
jgi:hypothetical protein